MSADIARWTAAFMITLCLTAFALAGPWRTVESDGDNTYTLFELTAASQIFTPEIHGTSEAALANNAESNLFTVTLLDGEMAGGHVAGVVHSSDGVDHQALVTLAQWTAVRKGASVSASITSSGGDDDDSATGGSTLVTVGASNGFSVSGTTASTATFALKANTSLTPSEFHFHFLNLNMHDSSISVP